MRRRRLRITLRHPIWVQTAVSDHLLIPAQLNKGAIERFGAIRGYLDTLEHVGRVQFELWEGRAQDKESSLHVTDQGN